jgi:hypothetical protein
MGYDKITKYEIVLERDPFGELKIQHSNDGSRS